MKSVTSTTPPASVWKLVTRMFVAGRYRCDEVYGAVGAIWNRPPRSWSRIAANRLDESKRGKQHQSIEPSSPTSAAVRMSPMIA